MVPPCADWGSAAIGLSPREAETWNSLAHALTEFRIGKRILVDDLRSFRRRRSNEFKRDNNVPCNTEQNHYSDFLMSAMASQSSGVSIVCSTVCKIKENTKGPRHWSLKGNPPMTGGFPSQRASNAENIFIWWRHHLIQTNTRKSSGLSDIPSDRMPRKHLSKQDNSLTRIVFIIVACDNGEISQRHE